MKVFSVTQVELVMLLMKTSQEDLWSVARHAKRGNAPLKPSSTKTDLIEMILLRTADEGEDNNGRFGGESKAVQAEKKRLTIYALTQYTRAYKAWFPSLTVNSPDA